MIHHFKSLSHKKHFTPHYNTKFFIYHILKHINVTKVLKHSPLNQDDFNYITFIQILQLSYGAAYKAVGMHMKYVTTAIIFIIYCYQVNHMNQLKLI